MPVHVITIEYDEDAGIIQYASQTDDESNKTPFPIARRMIHMVDTELILQIVQGRFGLSRPGERPAIQVVPSNAMPEDPH